MLADNTYISYCSHWRKYKRMMKETEGTPDFKYWEEQLIRTEAKILCGGREIPKEKQPPQVIRTTPSGGETQPAAESKEVSQLRNAYKLAVKLNDLPMIERFKGQLLKLGVEVKDEEPTGPTNGNGNGNAA